MSISEKFPQPLVKNFKISCSAIVELHQDFISDGHTGLTWAWCAAPTALLC